MAIGHNIPEDYKVQFTVNGLDAKFKQCVISKEPKTFQQLRQALALAKAELECTIENPTANISVNEICAAVAAQLQQTIKQEVSAIASAKSIGSDRSSNRSNPVFKNNGIQGRKISGDKANRNGKMDRFKISGDTDSGKMDRTQDHR